MRERLTGLGEVLFRQIHPSFIQDGVPSSQAFLPSAKDMDRLSVDRSSLTTAEAAHALYTAAGHASAAVYGLTVEEFGAEAIHCYADPLPGSAPVAPNQAHALADYSPYGVNQRKPKAKRLKQRAVERGNLLPATHQKSGD
jgi:hypothetical protein